MLIIGYVEAFEDEYWGKYRKKRQSFVLFIKFLIIW